MAGNGGLSLQLPGRPRSVLVERIDQPERGADRAGRTEGSLRLLLHACAKIAGDLDVDLVLHNLAESAAALTHAAHAAVVVHGTEKESTDVVHTGLTEAQVEVVRSRSAAPPLDGTLRHPLTVDNTAYGELHLFESAHGRFSAADGELVETLVGAAETALRNALSYEESRRDQRWLRASAQITQQILTTDGEDPVSVVARLAAEVADADLVTVSLLTDDGSELVVEAGSGRHAEKLLGERFAVGNTLSATVLAKGVPMQLPDYGTAGGDRQRLDSVIHTGPVLLVPLVGGARTWGLMAVIRRRGRRAFSKQDLVTASDFANQATISLELAEARDAQQRMRVLEDRERIARDLHDHVIQELFAIGIGMTNSAEADLVPEAVRRRLHNHVAALDRAIRRVRTSIFALRGSLDRTRDELRSALLDVATELTPVLGFSPAVQFSGAPGAVAEDLVEDVTAVAREALTNVARHARADSASIELIATSDRLLVVVTDDGIGIGEPHRHSGTSNLRTRAARRGGTCRAVPGAVRGTVLTWEVELT